MSTSFAHSLPRIGVFAKSKAPAAGRQVGFRVAKVPGFTNADTVDVDDSAKLQATNGNMIASCYRSSRSNRSVGFSTKVAADRGDSNVYAADQTFGFISKIRP